MTSEEAWKQAIHEVCYETRHYNILRKVQARAAELEKGKQGPPTKYEWDELLYTFDRLL